MAAVAAQQQCNAVGSRFPVCYPGLTSCCLPCPDLQHIWTSVALLVAQPPGTLPVLHPLRGQSQDLACRLEVRSIL